MGRSDAIASHGHELVRRRDILRAVPYRYLLPFLPAAVMFVLREWPTKGHRAAVLIPVVAGTAWLVRKLNRMMARPLDRQLNDVRALEGGQ